VTTKKKASIEGDRISPWGQILKHKLSLIVERKKKGSGLVRRPKRVNQEDFLGKNEDESEQFVILKKKKQQSTKGRERPCITKIVAETLVDRT